MTKQAIRWIVGLMSVSLVGLVCFQIYWVDSLIKANNEAFKRDVQEALVAVAEKLEKKEAMALAIDNFQTQFVFHSPSERDSASIEWIESTFEKKVVDFHHEIQDTSDLPDAIRFYFDSRDADPGLKKYDIQIKEPMDNRLAKGALILETKVDSSNRPGMDVAVRLKKVAKKSEYLQVAMHELFSGERTLQKRIAHSNVDSLLMVTLANKGIDLGYDFAVYDPLKRTMSQQRITSDKALLFDSELRTGLFPNDIMGEAGFLVIRFPNQQTFILSRLWLTLISSILLIAVIIACFAYAIHTIIKQKKLSDIKNDFINNMTHEFKTPISTVSLACEALQDHEISNTEGLKNRYLKIIDDENKRLGLQVEKVLQMAVIERKDFELKLQKVNVHEIIEGALDNIAIQVANRGGSIDTELRAAKQTLTADELHLTNIVYNLLDNANKYSPSGPKIKISTNDVAKGIIIKIIDEGIGMSKEMVNKIFDKFYRIPTGNVHDVKGFGLGLSYVKNMVEAHGGHIKVQSELKKGSAFTVFLPYEVAV